MLGTFAAHLLRLAFEPGVILCLANKKHCKRKCVNSLFRSKLCDWSELATYTGISSRSNAYSTNHRTRLDKLSGSQYLIGLFDKGVYNCAITRQK